MARIGTLQSSALALALLVGACGGYDDVAEEYGQNHPISVLQVTRDVYVGTDDRGRLRPDHGAISNISVDFARRGAGTVELVGPPGDVRVVARLLADAGLPVSAILPRPNRESGRGVNVIYRVSEAVSPSCGDFSSDRRPVRSAFNHPSSELGCVMQHNLARMISDPNDLIRRRGVEQPSGPVGRITGRISDWDTYERPPAPAASSSGASSGTSSGSSGGASGGR